MRSVIALLLLVGRGYADTAIEPSFALRAGAHYTKQSLTAMTLDDGGTPAGGGGAVVAEAGACIGAQWCVTGFVDYARFAVTLDREYPQPIEPHAYDTRFADTSFWGTSHVASHAVALRRRCGRSRRSYAAQHGAHAWR